MIEVVWDESTDLFSSLIVEVLEFLIEGIESEGMPFPELIGHIEKFDRDIPLRYKEYEVHENMPT